MGHPIRQDQTELERVRSTSPVLSFPVSSCPILFALPILFRTVPSCPCLPCPVPPHPITPPLLASRLFLSLHFPSGPIPSCHFSSHPFPSSLSLSLEPDRKSIMTDNIHFLIWQPEIRVADSNKYIVPIDIEFDHSTKCGQNPPLPFLLSVKSSSFKNT